MDSTGDFGTYHVSHRPHSVAAAARVTTARDELSGLAQRSWRPRSVVEALGSSEQRFEQRLLESSQRMERRLEEMRRWKSSAELFESIVRRAPRSVAAQRGSSLRRLEQRLTESSKFMEQRRMESIDGWSAGWESCSLPSQGLPASVAAAGTAATSGFAGYSGSGSTPTTLIHDATVADFLQPVHDAYDFSDSDPIYDANAFDDMFVGSNRTLLSTAYDDDLFVRVGTQATEDGKGHGQAEVARAEHHASSSPPFVEGVPTKCSRKCPNLHDGVMVPVASYTSVKEPNIKPASTSSTDLNPTGAAAPLIHQAIHSSNFYSSARFTCSMDGQNQTNFFVMSNEGPFSGEEHLQSRLTAIAAADSVVKGIDTVARCVLISDKSDSITANTSGIPTIKFLLDECICVKSKTWPPPIQEPVCACTAQRPLPWPTFGCDALVCDAWDDSGIIAKLRPLPWPSFSSSYCCSGSWDVNLDGHSQWAWQFGQNINIDSAAIFVRAAVPTRVSIVDWIAHQKCGGNSFSLFEEYQVEINSEGIDYQGTTSNIPVPDVIDRCNVWLLQSLCFRMFRLWDPGGIKLIFKHIAISYSSMELVWFWKRPWSVVNWFASFSPMQIDWIHQWLCIPYNGSFAVIQLHARQNMRSESLILPLRVKVCAELREIFTIIMFRDFEKCKRLLCSATGASPCSARRLFSFTSSYSALFFDMGMFCPATKTHSKSGCLLIYPTFAMGASGILESMDNCLLERFWPHNISVFAVSKSLTCCYSVDGTYDCDLDKKVDEIVTNGYMIWDPGGSMLHPLGASRTLRRGEC